MKAARIDDNQPAIVAFLRKNGMEVQVLSAVGKGCPDILVGFREVNVLIEIKDGAKEPARQKLTVAEQEWHDSWGGKVFIANTPEQAVECVVRECQRLGILSSAAGK